MTRIEVRETEKLDWAIQETRNTVRAAMESLHIEYWPGMRGKNEASERLLIWFQWSRIYKVSLRRLVLLIVTEYRRRYRRQGNALGIPMNILTSRQVEEWLRTQIAPLKHDPVNDVPFRRQYNSVEEYAEAMAQRRLARKKIRRPERVYRGTAEWTRPEMDVVRTLQRKQVRGVRSC